MEGGMKGDGWSSCKGYGEKKRGGETVSAAQG